MVDQRNPVQIPGDISEEEFFKQVFSKVDVWMKTRDEETITHNETPEQIKDACDITIPEKGEGLIGAIKGIDQFMEHSVRTHHPAFMNQFLGGTTPSALGGEIIAALCQTSMYTHELAPFATLIELEMLSKMAGLIGPEFKDGSGVFTTGGSNGNMLGLLLARQNKFPDSLNEGIDGTKLCVFVSAECHYSLVMSINVVGIGYNNLIKVGTDKDGKMDINKLNEAMEKCKAAGKIPLAVVGTAGTTVRGCFDPMREIAAVCKKNDCWFHIDGAWGGSILFSPKYRHHLDGGDLADSFSWDLHKMMGAPLMCSAFITKNVALLKTICGHSQTAHYLLHQDREDIDLGHRSLQCGRRNDALKGWLCWKEKGDEGFARVVENFIEHADYLESLVREHPRLEMMSSRVFANVNMRYNPTPGKTSADLDLNELNINLRNNLLQTGKFMIGRAMINEDAILRPVYCNNQTTRAVTDALLSEIVRQGDALIGCLSE